MRWRLLAFAAALGWGDLPPALRALFPEGEAGFPAVLDRVSADTARRVEEGEWDHFVFFLLQGRSFTAEPVVEPAVSAREFVESGKVPGPLRKRLDDLAASEAHSVRLDWARERMRGVDRKALLEHYARAMRFLYEKEWATRPLDGAGRRARIAELYQTRGHSSDTSPESVKAMEQGLDALRRRDPKAKPASVLLVGPGSDFAPRTALREDRPPGSYQLEFLRRTLPEATVECIDVNPRVVRTLGCAEQVDILTGHRGRRYDLVVVHNVFVYFSRRELALALANIRAMLAAGGYLLHNELRDEIEPLARAAGLALVDARTVRMGGTEERPLYDGAILHRLSR